MTIASRIAILASLLIGALTAAAAHAEVPNKPATFSISSPAFIDGGNLPIEFTCDGNRASPPLKWSAPPAGTRFFAVTMHHTASPGDTHVYMVIYNIPADTRSLSKNARDVGVFGINTVNGKQEYTPPCSKGPGKKTYTITLYALSAEPSFTVAANAVTMKMLVDAIKDKTLATVVMNVSYDRKTKAGVQTRPGEAGGPRESDSPENHADRRGEGGPPELRRALQALTLTDAQKAKVDAIVQQFHENQEKARTELLKQLNEVLDATQYKEVEDSFKRPPPPPPSTPRQN